MCRGFGELFFSFFEKHLDFLKQVFFHDGSVGAGGVVHIFLATVLGLLEGHSRAAVGFLITAVSDISLIGEHIGDLGGFPFLFAVLCWHPTIRQILGNFRCGHSAKVCLEDPPYNISFRRVFHKLLVFEVETVGSIAVYIDAKLHSFDDGESLVLGDCLGFLLGNGGEGVQEHLVAEGHGKGAVSAQKNEKLLIPINMRDGSLICVGKGNPEWNYSAPHGAGRLFSRGVARKMFTVEAFANEMEGIYTTSVGQDTLDECPMAYKPIDSIVNNIGPTVDIVKIIRPVYNFKASE